MSYIIATINSPSQSYMIVSVQSRPGKIGANAVINPLLWVTRSEHSTNRYEKKKKLSAMREATGALSSKFLISFGSPRLCVFTLQRTPGPTKLQVFTLQRTSGPMNRGIHTPPYVGIFSHVFFSRPPSRYVAPNMPKVQ